MTDDENPHHHLGEGLPLDPDVEPEEVGRPPAGVHKPPVTLPVLAAVLAGGFLGTLARYEVERAWPAARGGLPVATLAINTSGAFLLALLVAVLVARRHGGHLLRPFAATGVLGGWTTYSTLAVEAVTLVKVHHAGTAVGYLALSLVAGLAAAVAGMALGRRVALPQAVGP